MRYDSESPVTISGFGFLSYQYSSILSRPIDPEEVFLILKTVTMSLPTRFGCPWMTSMLAVPLIAR